MDRIETDILIIGSGIAGATTALVASESNCKITLITRSRDPLESNTFYAQGGIIYRGKKDSPKKIMQDITDCGGGIVNTEMAKILSREGKEAVDEILIKKTSVNFQRDKTGYLLSQEAAHSRPRILYHKDNTGEEIEKSLIMKIRERKNIKILDGFTAIDLITLSHHSLNSQDVYEMPTCRGAYVLDQKSGKIRPILAKEVVVATGGLGRIFLHTTNPMGARGDGIAMAYRAGVRVINLEYVQFHPTTFYHAESERFLISESLRGNGGILLNASGERFMERYHKDRELASRDIVSRSIHSEIIKTKSENVFLDISFKDPSWVKDRFPSIYERCLKYEIDITKDPIPVVPSAHYSCGGIYTDKMGNTTMKSLKAVGETACTGLHGANRLASTSLLEGLVWGKIVALDITKRLKENKYKIPDVAPWKYEQEAIDPALLYQDWLMIKHTMWNYVGLVRNNKRLHRARDIMKELVKEIERFYAAAKLTDDIIGLRNGALTALLIINAAIQNKKSLGCHYVED